MRKSKKMKETMMMINLSQNPLVALFAFTLKPQFLKVVSMTREDLTFAFLPTFPSPQHSFPTQPLTLFQLNGLAFSKIHLCLFSLQAIHMLVPLYVTKKSFPPCWANFQIITIQHRQCFAQTFLIFGRCGPLCSLMSPCFECVNMFKNSGLMF